MDRLFTRTVLVLVTAGALISISSQEEQLNVRVETKQTEVCDGDTVTINCTFEPAGKYKVAWFYNQTPLLNCDSNRIPEEKRFHVESNDSWSTLIIQSFNTSDSGWYYCKVIRDIPYLKEQCSNGINVTVDANRTNTNLNQAQNPTTDNSPTTCLISATAPTSPSVPSSSYQWWIWVALAVGCVVLVVAVVVLVILNRQNTEAIYENTKPKESSCWRRKQNQVDICNIPSSKQIDTIKPLRKYDTLSSHRKHRP